MNKYSDLKEIELFLLDMDGTIYLDDDVIPGAIEFIKKIRNQNKKYIFLTNNSSKSKEIYLNKLNRLGFYASSGNIFTSGMAMGLYLNKYYPNKSCYVMGTNALINELKNYNINIVSENPDIVIAGFDRELTTEKLEKACKFIDDGSLFLATNPDLVCPIANKRYVPDCGSMCKMIENATSKKPFYIGKPNPYMIDLLKEKYNIESNKICVIGDRLYTDIASGLNAHTKTICVLSGESTIDTINSSPIKPDYIFNSIKDLIDLI